MPKRLPISAKDKARIFKHYAQGETPFAISTSLREVNLSPRQVANLIQREGWAKRKAEIAEVKQRTAIEILEQARRDGVQDFEAFIKATAESLKIDAARLRDGWDLVEDAAGASSLMRAKKLLLQRGLETFGLAGAAEHSGPTQKDLLALVFTRFQPATEPRPVEPVTEPGDVLEFA